jgi:hypothetical protein
MMDLFQLREQFSKDGIMICFNGPFSHSIIEEIGTAIRNHLGADNVAPLAVQDVFAVYIEMAQNARNYLTTKNISGLNGSSATIAIAKQGDVYSVTAGNVILLADEAELCQHIDRINSLAATELKQLIRQHLRSKIPAGATGAGIGLLEIARRASANLAYTMQKIDDRHGFFTLTVTI